MPYPNQHAARIREPEGFIKTSFITKQIAAGITIIAGKLKSGGTALVTQAYRFAKDKYTASAAKEWMKRNKIKYIKFEEAEDTKDTNEVNDMAKKGKLDKNEIYATIPNSIESMLNKIKDAIDKNNPFGMLRDNEYVSVEATFDDSIIVYKWGDGERKYYQAKWKTNKEGEVEFSDIKQVEVNAVIKVKNEMRERAAMVSLNESVDMNETIDISFILEKKEEEADELENYSSKAIFKQEHSGNNREYPPQVMKEAIDDVKSRLPILMEIQHPRDGNMVTDLEKTAAIINKVERTDDGQIILEDIKFVPTEAGKTMFGLSKTLAKSGAKLGISQRATGKSHYVKNESTGAVKEVVDWLRIKKWDFTAPNEQGVKDAQFELLMEENEMADKKVLTEDEVTALLGAQKTEFMTMIDELKNAQAEPPKVEEPKVEPKQEKKEESDGNKLILEMQQKFNDATEKLNRLTRKEQMTELITTGTRLMTEELTKEDYKRFSEAEKKVLLESVDFEVVYPKVDMSKPESITATILESLKNEINQLDRLIAASKLRETGYPKKGTGNGITNVEVINENVPGMEQIKRLEKDVERAIDPYNKYWKLPDDHHGQSVINEIMNKYYKDNHEKLMLEANEEFKQDDIGARIATINAVVIPAALRRLTAMKFCNVVNMKALLDFVLIESYVPTIESNVHTNLALFQPTEDGTLTMVGSTTVGYPIVATEKGFRTMITTKAIATAKNSVIDPVVMSVASMAKLGAQITDQYIYEFVIARTQGYDASEVSSWETLTKVGATAEYQSVNQGWIKYEPYKHYDGNGNPDDAKLLNLFGTTSGNVLQKIEIGHGGTPTVLTYGTHYTINFADGSVTLTAAGVSAVSTDDVKAKYSYTNNAKFWSVTGGAGTVTLYDWLLNLQQMIGQAKVLIRKRHYDPDFAVAGITVEDLISKGPQFNASMSQQGSVKDALTNVITYDGLPMDRSGWAPDHWVIVGAKGAVIFGVHTPPMVSGPVEDTTTTSKYYKYNGFTAVDVPVPAQFSLVGITDLASL